MQDLIPFLAPRYGQRPPEPHHRQVIQVDDGGYDVPNMRCDIYVAYDPADPDRYRLELKHVPHDDAVLRLVEELDGEIHRPPGKEQIDIVLRLGRKDHARVRQLGKAIGRVVANGHRWPNHLTYWKWSAEKAEHALGQLADHLLAYRAATQGRARSRAAPVHRKSRR